MAKRITRDEYFLILAQAAALRSTCPRRQVGAVLVADGDLVSSGFNGSSPGKPHCEDVGCFMVNGHCLRTTHAEQNALGRGQRGDTLYCTDSPCLMCLKLALTNGVRRLVYQRVYECPERELFIVENGLAAMFERLENPTLCLSHVEREKRSGGR